MLTALDIISLIKSVQPDDIIDQTKQALNIFDQYNHWIAYPQIQDVIDYHRDQQALETEVVDKIVTKIRSCLDDLMTMQGFSFTSEATLSDKLIILEAMRVMMSLEDKAYVNRLIESDKNDVEVFAEVLSLCCEFCPENILTLVGKVPYLFRSILKENYVEDVEVFDYTGKEFKTAKEIFEKFKLSQDGIVPTYAHAIAQYPSGYCFDLEALYELYLSSNIIQTDTNDEIEELVREFYALCCISTDYHAKVQEGCRLLITKAFSNMLQRSTAEKFSRNIAMRIK